MLAACALAAPAACLADYAIQVGAYREPQHVASAVERLRKDGFLVMTERTVSGARLELTRVLVGPYAGLREAKLALAALRRRGWSGCYIRELPTTPPKRAAPAPPAVPPPAPLVVPPAPIRQPERAVPPPAAKPPAPEPRAAPAEPKSIDELFARPEAEPQKPGTDAPPAEPRSMEELFAKPEAPAPTKVHGFYLLEAARTTPEPAHGSVLRNTVEVGARGGKDRIKWKLSARAAYDAIFELEDDFYPKSVRDDQRREAMLRETYLDISAGNWDLRLGRQHIIWGEVVGLFFADVVSAKDLREFVLPDFDLMRTPQWATRVEYFRGDFHAEAIWIPYMTYDEIGVPGSDFYPYPPAPPAGNALVINDERRPPNTLANAAYGLRLSHLAGGWDTALFYYDSNDPFPTFFRQIVPGAYIYTPEHVRIEQTGATTSKDFGPFVLKAEAVYTRGRLFNVTRTSDADGVARQDYLDYIVALDFPLPRDTRFNLQFFQRRFSEHDPDTGFEETESGASALIGAKFFGGKLEPQLLVIYGFEHEDSLIRPSLAGSIGRHWRWTLGVDYFNGPAMSFFGRYADKDRVYAHLRYTF